MILGWVAPPDVDLASEVGVEFVDCGHQDRLLVPRRPVERVHGDAAIDPARRVAREDRVRQRRQQILGDARGLADQLQHLAAVGLREIVGGQPADQSFGQFAGGQTFQVAADLVDQAEPDLVRHHLVVEDPFLGFGDRHGLRQQIMHLHDLDPAVAHLLHKVEMVALGDVDPDHVVEQQFVAIARSQARMRAPRRTDHDLAQLTDLGVDAELRALGVRHDDLRFLDGDVTGHETVDADDAADRDGDKNDPLDWGEQLSILFSPRPEVEQGTG